MYTQQLKNFRERSLGSNPIEVVEKARHSTAESIVSKPSTKVKDSSTEDNDKFFKANPLR